MGKTKVPQDKALIRELQDAVALRFRSGDMENLTVKRVRAAVEEKLKLPEGYFKNDERWNQKSKEIIERESVSIRSHQIIAYVTHP